MNLPEYMFLELDGMAWQGQGQDRGVGEREEEGGQVVDFLNSFPLSTLAYQQQSMSLIYQSKLKR